LLSGNYQREPPPDLILLLLQPPKDHRPLDIDLDPKVHSPNNVIIRAAPPHFRQPLLRLLDRRRCPQRLRRPTPTHRRPRPTPIALPIKEVINSWPRLRHRQLVSIDIVVRLRRRLDTRKRVQKTLTTLETLARESLGFSLCALGFAHIFGVGFAVGAVELREAILLRLAFFGGAGSGFVQFGAEGEFRGFEGGELGVDLCDGGFVALLFGDLATAEDVIAREVGEAVLEYPGALELLLDLYGGPGAVEEVVDVGDFGDKKGFCGMFQLFAC